MEPLPGFDSLQPLRPARFLTPPSRSSGRSLSTLAPSRPLSLTPPPPNGRLLSSPSSFSSHQHQPLSSSTALLSSSVPPLSFPLSAAEWGASKARSVPSSSHSLSGRSYLQWLFLLTFSLLLSLLFIVHMSVHAVPLSEPIELSPVPAAAVGPIRVAPNSLHGPASSLQPQLLFSRSVAARQLESFADRKKRKEAIATEEQVEQDMRRMSKISEHLKADWEAKQRTSSVDEADSKKPSAQKPQTVQLRGGAATGAAAGPS